MMRNLWRLWRMARWGRSGDRSGLTTRCNGCGDQSPHDAHLAPGALRFLGGAK